MSKKKKNTKTPKPTPQPKIKKQRTLVSDNGFWKRHFAQGIILLLLPFILYGMSIKYGYVLDDKLVLSENNFVKKGFDGIGDIFSSESFTGYLGTQQDLVVGARYRPLSIATFAAEYQFFGLNPKISHFLNILLYGLSGLLLFRVLALFLPERKDKRWYFGLAFLAALLFILHPIHTEVVANIKGRDEILTLLLSLGTFYFSYRYAVYRKKMALLLSGLAFFVALLAKENAVTFLAVIPITLVLFTKVKPKTILMTLAPLMVAFVLYLLLRIGVIGYLLDSGKEVTGIMNNPFYGLSWNERYAMISYTLGKYLQLLFFPHPLTHDYYPYQVPVMTWTDWRALLSLVFNLGLFAVAIRWFRKLPILSWSILFYFATLSIVSNIVFPVGAPMNERFLYFSSVGFCLALAYLAVELLPGWLKLKSPANYWFSLGLLGVIALGYSIKTISRVPAWENEMTLNRAAIKVSTNSARANSYMAYSLYRAGLEEPDANKKKALFDEATPYVDRALQIYPEYTDALTCKGGILAGYYQMNGNLDVLLEGFYKILAANHVSFIDQYVEYLNGRADTRKMAAFYHRVGYELLAVAQKNYPLAIKYLNYGLQVAPNDPALLKDLETVTAIVNDKGTG
ncbi:MAG: hypothetical protein DHS20C18_53090 [Saprospiraceae bacterium]|nr:MAG: hypothetical protein DHS20C18_53090 [Saprospiraceae bacterium]